VEVRDMGQLVSPLHGAITVQMPRGDVTGPQAIATVVRVEKTVIHGSQGSCLVMQGNPSSLHLDNNGAWRIVRWWIPTPTPTQPYPSCSSRGHGA
jgi:hypothetical protein